MAKKPKKAPQPTAAVDHLAASESKSPVRCSQARVKKNGAAPVKKTATPRVAKPLKKTAAPPARHPTDEEIQLRAYFIAERRHRLHLPGDTSSDWIEAKRQLST